ncbi:MAG: PIN domain-containing protein [Chloroflexota bacterium]
MDSNVLIDILGDPGPWTAWSADALAAIAEEHELVINPVVYAEIAVGYESIEELEAAIPTSLLRREEIPYPAAFLAATCFRDYRRRGGIRTGVLPDFLIGAHAAVAGLRLLTRDARRFRTYFPTLDIIAPG